MSIIKSNLLFYLLKENNDDRAKVKYITGEIVMTVLSDSH